RMAARQEESGSDLGPFVLIALGAGALLWLLPKAFPRAFVATPSVGPGSPPSAPPSQTAPHPLLSALSNTWDRLVNRDLINLLSGSQVARKAFLFQAGMYSFYQTDARPDGKNGPVT